jgi:hypothetical protein
MKKIFLLLLVFGFFSLNAFAQTDDNMKKWTDYMTPGKEHSNLAKMNGDWNYTAKFWMDPSAPPQTSDGTATCEMLLGGRYMQMKVSGKMMVMDFNGIDVTGYDNGKKVYVSSWIDNMGTGLMYMEGTYDDASKKVVYTGKMYDPMSGKDIVQKQTIKTIDDNNVLMEMYNVVDGKDVKSMEMNMVKK